MLLYKQRYEKRIDELHELYMSLYNNQDSFNELVSNIEQYYLNRSLELKQLDIKRENNPSWYKNENMLGMTLYTDLFSNDLKGLIEKVDYLKEQKITYLHLMPLLQMPHPENDGGYAVSDFKTVDSTLGNNDDLMQLTKKLRENDISLCLDFVMNHTADSHNWAMRAKENNQRYKDYYMCYENREIPDLYEQTMTQVFPTTAPGNFTWNEEMKSWVLTTFYPYQWDLNYKNPAVLNEMIFNMLHLANLGVEVLRIDAVPYIWKELHTSCRNLPQVHTIVRIIRLIIEIVCPCVLLKGEVVMAPQELAAYFGTVEAPECHMLYNVSTMVNLWSSLASVDVRLLKRQLDNIHSLPDHCYFVNYIRCHDDIGWGLDETAEVEFGIDPLEHKKYLYQFFSGSFSESYAKGELYNFDPISEDARSCGTSASLCGIEKAIEEGDEQCVNIGVQRVLLMHCAMYSMLGFPMLSSGDEIGQLNGYDYHHEKTKSSDSRNVHRTKFNWENAKKRFIKNTLEYNINNGIKTLEQYRSKYSVFGFNSHVTTWDTHNDKVLAVIRTSNSKKMICLFNFSKECQTIYLDAIDGMYEDVFTRQQINATSAIQLNPYQYVWALRV